MIRLIDLLPTCLLTLAIFDVFSQIQYNGGMLRQGQCLYGTGSAYRDDTGYFFAVLMTCLMRNCEEFLCIQ